MKYIKSNKSFVSESKDEKKILQQKQAYIEKQAYIDEILSNDGWEKIDPPSNDNWDTELVYKLKDDIYIDVLSWSKGLNYYLRQRKDVYYVGTYDDGGIALYSKFNSAYRDLSNYDRMMKNCKWNLKFFENYPSDDLINKVKECFIEISDYLEETPLTDFGFCHSDNSEFCFFPASRFSDKLYLCLFYVFNGQLDVFDNVVNEFNDIKGRLQTLDIDDENAKIVNDDNFRIVIAIDLS